VLFRKALKPNIFYLPETGSTNSYAIEMLTKARPDEGSVIITDHQTNGKGTDSKTWESEKGKNLTFSIILYPTITADKQFLLNKAISLGICNSLRAELNQDDITIKWPNDIYIADKKVCGILIQNSIIGDQFDYMVIGIGLNINQTVFLSDAPNPVSLKQKTGKEYDLEKLLENLLKSVLEKYLQVLSGQELLIENEYYNAIYRLMEWHEFLINGIKTIARITGTNEYGQLILETESGLLLKCDLKEVKFII